MDLNNIFNLDKKLKCLCFELEKGQTLADYHVKLNYTDDLCGGNINLQYQEAVINYKNISKFITFYYNVDEVEIDKDESMIYTPIALAVLLGPITKEDDSDLNKAVESNGDIYGMTIKLMGIKNVSKFTLFINVRNVTTIYWFDILCIKESYKYSKRPDLQLSKYLIEECEKYINRTKEGKIRFYVESINPVITKMFINRGFSEVPKIFTGSDYLYKDIE